MVTSSACSHAKPAGETDHLQQGSSFCPTLSPCWCPVLPMVSPPQSLALLLSGGHLVFSAHTQQGAAAQTSRDSKVDCSSRAWCQGHTNQGSCRGTACASLSAPQQAQAYPSSCQAGRWFKAVSPSVVLPEKLRSERALRSKWTHKSLGKWLPRQTLVEAFKRPEDLMRKIPPWKRVSMEEDGTERMKLTTHKSTHSLITS